MRWVLALVIVAAAGCVAAGLVDQPSAVRVDGSSLSMRSLDAELAAIATSKSYQCYLEARTLVQDQAAPTLSATAPTWLTDSAVYWADLRAADLTLEATVGRKDPAAFSAAHLAAARASLESAITDTLNEALSETEASEEQSGSGTAFSCPGELDGAGTLASMPSWFVAGQVRAQAATLGLAALIPSPVPTSGPSLEAWFGSHRSMFKTVCIAWVVVATSAEATRVEHQINDGSTTIAAAARAESLDTTTKDKGGSIGCYSPNSSYWTSASSDVASLSIGHVSTFADGSDYAVLGPTSRYVEPFAEIEKGVANSASEINLQSEQLLATEYQAAASISVSDELGTWTPSSSGGTIAVPVGPPASSLLNATAVTPSS